MKEKIVLALGCMALSSMAVAAMEDDPLLFHVLFERLEVQDSDGANQRAWDMQAWLGKDLHKLVFQSEGEYHQGRVEEMENQLLYRRAFAPYWDVQLGWRRDVRPQPGRDWLVVGVTGVAPYFVETTASLFVGEAGRAAARLDLEYELMFTQRLALTPEVEINLYSKDDPAMHRGAGLSTISAGLRLGYAIRREFAPYVGVHWSGKYGDTADYARAQGEQVEDARLVLGVRAWF